MDMANPFNHAEISALRQEIGFENGEGAAAAALPSKRMSPNGKIVGGNGPRLAAGGANSSPVAIQSLSVSLLSVCLPSTATALPI